MDQCITDENIWFMTETNVYLDYDDLAILETYLQKQLEIGSNNMRTIKLAIFGLFDFVRTTAIKTINRQMVIAYFTDLNTRLCKNRIKVSYLSYETKKTNRAILFAFFRYYKELIEETFPDYVIPIPSSKIFEFKRPMETIEESQGKIKEFSYTVEQMILTIKTVREKILSSTHLISLYFPAILLMMFTGMRISECLTIRKANLHLSEGYLITGLDENARKNYKPLTFVFPREVGLVLQEYLLEFNKENNPYLFTGSNRGSHFAKSSFENFVRQLSLEIGFKVEPHSFRKTLITNLIHVSKCPTHIVETLTNHAITSVIFRNYDQYSIELRKTDYFEYLPKSYRAIIDFLNQL